MLARASSSKLKVVHTLKNLQFYVVEVGSADVANYLATLPGVKSVTKDNRIPLPKFPMMSLPTDNPGMSGGVLPWGVKAVKAPEAWGQTQGENVKVAVIDTGVDRDHPALKGNFAAGKNFAQLDKQVDYDYFDVYGHGTHVAGTILGDGTTLYGVAPKAKLYSARVCQLNGCAYSDIYAGVDWGIENHVDVMNLSLGGSSGGQEEINVFKRAREAGITVIAAAGNDGAAQVSYPAAIDTGR
jgi:subtilisin family serine protease